MKKQRILLCLAVIFSLFLWIPVNAAGDANDPVEITANEYDTAPMPDKYNTGVKGELTKIDPNGMVSGIQIKKGEVAAVFKFATMNTQISGRVIIENYDFSDYDFNTYEEDITDRDITVVFRNCRFGTIYKALEESRVFYEFENCSLIRFQGSNASFSHCAIGGSYQDGMNIYRHVRLKDCYFSDFYYKCESGEYHTDGIHIFGKAGVDVTDITVDHCRFEIPYNSPEGSKAYVNSCIMLAPKYSNASGITVRDCFVNGGGYTIYATDRDEYKLSDTQIENIRVGGAALFGSLYPTVAEGATISDISSIDSLLVGYVGKEEDRTVFSVTNDTTVERTLRIITDTGIYTETIPASPGGRGLRDVTVRLDFPTDILISVPEKVTYALCLDVTDPENVKQIRFVNYGNDPVYLTREQIQGETGSGNPTERFVERMYSTCLGRASDADGAKYWADQLASGAVTGAQLAEKFVFSLEANQKNLSDEAFLTMLYKAMMDREPDAEGMQYWLTNLSNEMARYEVLDGFVMSSEFGRICSEYKITRGTLNAETAGIEKFVKRMYEKSLERTAEQEGIFYWTFRLREHQEDGASFAYKVFFSEEMRGRNLSDEKYAELLYNAMMDRLSDAEGKTYWLNKMDDGMTREQVLNGFILSPEFKSICEAYGIVQGSL